MTNTTYRNDISGLRAVAVLLVIFYHLDFTLVSGGFVGVDVFFVLSGFLITSMVYKEVSVGNFSFKQFYVRRVRRLIPILLVVLLVTCVFFWFILLPQDYYRLSNSAGASFLSISNFYFKNITAGYWGASSQTLPLIHTWSLSVEEQFYIIWPALLITLHKFLPKHLHSYLIAGLVVILLFLSEYLARFSPDMAYYLLPARAFELLLGALLALTINKLPRINTTLNHIISLIGLVGIVLMSLLLQKGDIFPGLNASIVCFSTVLLLLTGKDHANMGIVNQILSKPLMVYIGLISYSLYLWHWPLVAFFNYFSIEKTVSIQLFILALTVILSVLSYHGVEQVFREKILFTPNKTLIIFLALPFVFFLSFVFITKEYNGFPERFSAAENQNISVFVSTSYKHCSPPYCTEDFKNKFSTKHENADFLLIGDSHAAAMEGFFNLLANHANKNGTLISNGGNPFLINLDEVDKRSGEFSNFSKRNQKIKQTIENFNGDTIVLTARFSKYTDKNNESYFTQSGKNLSYEQSVIDFQNSTLDTINFILSENKKLIIIEDVPYFPLDRSKCALLTSFIGSNKLCTSSESLAVIEDFQKIETKFFAEIKPQFPQVTFINTRSLLCDSERCHAQFNGVTLYKDNGHLNYIGSKILGELFLQSQPNPL